jgi:hypothetical protein
MRFGETSLAPIVTTHDRLHESTELDVGPAAQCTRPYHSHSRVQLTAHGVVWMIDESFNSELRMANTAGTGERPRQPVQAPHPDYRCCMCPGSGGGIWWCMPGGICPYGSGGGIIIPGKPPGKGGGIIPPPAPPPP